MTERGIHLRLCRSIQVEGAFALLKNDVGFRRFLTWGKANIYSALRRHKKTRRRIFHFCDGPLPLVLHICLYCELFSKQGLGIPFKYQKKVSKT